MNDIMSEDERRGQKPVKFPPIPKPISNLNVDQPSFLKTPTQKPPAPNAPMAINPLTLQPAAAMPVDVPVVPAPMPTSAGAAQEATTGDLYHDLGVFFGELQESYADRYRMWEDSINSVLLIMRKMQATTTENTKLLIDSIVDFHERVKVGLEKFEKKRNAVEKYSGADLWGTVKQLKRVMGILKLQIQEYELKSRVDTYLKYIAGL